MDYAGIVQALQGSNTTAGPLVADNVVSRFAAEHSLLATTVGGLAATYVFFWALLQFTQDANEPPLVLTAVPFLSPIVGIVRRSLDFYVYMRDKYPSLPTYTLRLPGLRVYMVNSTSLIPAVQRQWRTLLFPPVTAWASEVAMGGSKEAVNIIREDMVTENGFMHAFIKAIHPALSKGPALDNLSRNALGTLSKSLDSIAAQGSKRVDMYEWIRHEIMMAMTDSVYGPHNPLRDPANEADWLKYHPAIMFLTVNLLPQWVFGGAIAARNRLANAFLRYHDAGHYKQGSVYIQRWTEQFASWSIPPADVARFHNGNLFALVANTIPTAFWTIYHVFSDPTVLRECREEVERTVTLETLLEGNGDEVRTISAAAIKEGCPTLASTFQEVLRIHGMVNSVRVVSENHVLDGKYLLKKGGLVMVPARVQHRSKEAWGDNADEFDHRRFIRKPGEPRPNPNAFRGFGGGTTLCPGRHFATTEILLFTAMLLLRFDIVRVGDGGKWVLPTAANSSQAEAVEQPDYDFQIELRPRPVAARKWVVSFGGDEESALVAEEL